MSTARLALRLACACGIASLLVGVGETTNAQPVTSEPPLDTEPTPAGTEAFTDQPIITGPTVSLDRYEMGPGERLVLTLDGFEANSVIISVCGNDARRGSTDCNMPESEGLRLDRAGNETISSIPVAVPPAPCPCLIRVSSSTNDEIAVAAITLVGHPIAPVVGSPAIGDRLALSVEAVAAPVGLLGGVKSSLAGATPYEVTVSVRNRSTETLDTVRLTASAGRTADEDLVAFDLTNPDVIEPGKTVTQTVTAELPAPVYGSVEWRVVASGAGPSTEASDETSHTPWLLVVLAAVLVADVALIAWRFIVRSRRRRRDSDPEPDDSMNGDDSDVWATTEIVTVESREPQLVS